MVIRTVFERYELKYLLTAGQKQEILDIMAPYMKSDEYGRTTIRNLYYDTDTYLLIRNSIENGIYKEKLRVRSYCRADSDSAVFVELKKKYDDVVYKRRVSLPEKEASGWLGGGAHCRKRTQITDEIDYFLGYYKTLHPAVFLSYDREAYYSCDGTDLRITFDDNILCRQNNLSLKSEIYGKPLLPDGTVLMEIKCSGGIPLWMTRALSEKHIPKTSFSKYGHAYRTMIFPKLHNSPATQKNKEIPIYDRKFV